MSKGNKKTWKQNSFADDSQRAWINVKKLHAISENCNQFVIFKAFKTDYIWELTGPYSKTIRSLELNLSESASFEQIFEQVCFDH